MLEPQIAALLQEIGPRGGDRELEIGELRAQVREFGRTYSGVPEPLRSIEDVDVAGVKARLYRPDEQQHAVLVWFHGGGWICGSPAEHEVFACALAKRAACAVLSVDYRLAPEHPYPAAVDDCWTATTWAGEHLGQVAIGGDSAGGTLAAAVALRARDAGVDLALQLLVYPALDPDLDSPFVRDFVARYTEFAGEARYGEASRGQLRRAWGSYIPDVARRRERDASPLRATSLEGVAPVLMILAEHDILRGECELYAERLREARVPVEVHCYSGQLHSFYTLLGSLDDAGDAVDRSATGLRRAFSGHGIPGDGAVGAQRPLRR